ncbi:MAG: type I restriction endonuclease subunit S [Azoarcus sp.]|nr:MAG: type I restriction endonuclease subunit S [Azoarcus sp.]
MSATLEAREPVARYLATPPLLQHFDRVAQAPGGVARLRELILTLAVQGKLVPQDPADEPASVLLERIRAEKARLVKEGEVRKEKPLAAIAEEERPFALPMGWEWVRMPEIYYSISPSSNKVLSSSVQEEGAYPVVDQGKRYIAGYTDIASLLICLPGPVVIFGDHTTERKYVDFDFVAGADGVKILRPLQLNEKFFFHQLLWYRLEDRGYARHFKILNSQLFALPPFAEQSRIVARVEELMALCDTLEETGRLAAVQHERLASALFDTLTNSATEEEAGENWQRIAPHFDLLLDRTSMVDRLEQTILQLAVRGRLVPQNPADEPASVLLQNIGSEKDHLIATGKIKRDKPLPPIGGEEKPFELPKLWEWVRLGQVIELVSGQHLLPSEYSENLDLAIPYLTGPAEFGKMYPQPTRSTNERRAIATNEDILITVKGSGVGKLNLVGVEELAISRQLMAIRPIIVGHDFLFLALSVLGGSFLEKSVGIAIPGISRVDVTEAVVALPPIAEQSRIVARVAELRALCAQLRDRLAATAKTQSRLAEALVDGLG